MCAITVVNELALYSISYNDTCVHLAYFLLASCTFDSLAHASHCVLDSSDNNRPVVGHINICPTVILLYNTVIVVLAF